MNHVYREEINMSCIMASETGSDFEKWKIFTSKKPVKRFSREVKIVDYECNHDICDNSIIGVLTIVRDDRTNEIFTVDGNDLRIKWSETEENGKKQYQATCFV